MTFLESVLADLSANNDPINDRMEAVFKILELLPRKPVHGYWYDGEEILTPDEIGADAVADFIDALVGERISHTGFYDPHEDERSGEVDDHTGYYYVDFD